MPYEAAMREYETRVKAALEKIGPASFRLEFDRTAPAHMISHHAIEDIILPELRSACQPEQSAPGRADVVIHAEALHSGRINPRLFGNFVELLDDVAPALWAEMLNDRSFEGVRRVDRSGLLRRRAKLLRPRMGSQRHLELRQRESIQRLAQRQTHGHQSATATLNQAGLAVKRGLSYSCSGWFRADQSNLQATVSLKTILPTGEAMTLASAKLPAMSPQWQKVLRPMRPSARRSRIL
jgi:hypothetical protein